MLTREEEILAFASRYFPKYVQKKSVFGSAILQRAGYSIKRCCITTFILVIISFIYAARMDILYELKPISKKLISFLFDVFVLFLRTVLFPIHVYLLFNKVCKYVIPKH